jgi:hypothetical protein
MNTAEVSALLDGAVVKMFVIDRLKPGVEVTIGRAETLNYWYRSTTARFAVLIMTDDSIAMDLARDQKDLRAALHDAQSRVFGLGALIAVAHVVDHDGVLDLIQSVHLELGGTPGRIRVTATLH